MVYNRRSDQLYSKAQEWLHEGSDGVRGQSGDGCAGRGRDVSADTSYRQLDTLRDTEFYVAGAWSVK